MEPRYPCLPKAIPVGTCSLVGCPMTCIRGTSWLAWEENSCAYRDLSLCSFFLIYLSDVYDQFEVLMAVYSIPIGGDVASKSFVLVGGYTYCTCYNTPRQSGVDVQPVSCMSAWACGTAWRWWLSLHVGRKCGVSLSWRGKSKGGYFYQFSQSCNKMPQKCGMYVSYKQTKKRNMQKNLMWYYIYRAEKRNVEGPRELRSLFTLAGLLDQLCLNWQKMIGFPEA